MKIGILTYHRAENYGALLQAYGLKTYLQSLGHDVSFVDYWPDYHNEYFELFSLQRFKKVGMKAKLVMLYNLLFYFARKKRKQNLQSFMYSKLGLPKKARYSSKNDVCNEFDAVFYGSDQIWRKQGMPSHPGFDFWYYASSNVVANRKIAYAASIGPINLTSEDEEMLKKQLSNFSQISVRESSLQDLLTSFGVKSQIVTDPVFLLNPEQWRKLIPSNSDQKGKYILMYNLLGSNETVVFAEQLSQNYHLPIIEISKRYGLKELGSRYNHTAKVEVFLSLIDNAAYVVSNSFHGVALSVILEKQFYAVGMGDKADRVKSLLKLLDIQDRYIESNQYETETGSIEYKAVKELLSSMRSSSLDFISESLQR